MHYYRFLQRADVQEPNWLSSRTDYFSVSEEEGDWIYLPLATSDEAKNILAITPSFMKYEEVIMDENIDWNEQWTNHSPNFKDNLLEVNLASYTNVNEPLPLLYLHAGPGFGDLSHPTTRLTLSLMASHVKGKAVLDVGCGSGILTLAAIHLGATSAYGVDIEPEALLHAQKNAVLNQIEDRVSFRLPKDFLALLSDDIVILMNMIRSQQEEAWKSLPQIHHLSGTCFTSGVLASERELYLNECSKKGWELIEEKQQDQWMAFHFKLGNQ